MRSGGSKIDEAVALLGKKQGPCSEPALNTYRRLTTALLSRKNEEEGPAHTSSVGTLRDVLYRLANLYKNSGERHLGLEMDDLLMATHYQHMLYSAHALGLKDITARCAVTLLKYPDTVPQDKAFYQAGVMCKEQGNTNLAFMLLNRYADRHIITSSSSSCHFSFNPLLTYRHTRTHTHAHTHTHVFMHINTGSNRFM